MGRFLPRGLRGLGKLARTMLWPSCRRFSVLGEDVDVLGVVGG